MFSVLEALDELMAYTVLDAALGVLRVTGTMERSLSDTSSKLVGELLMIRLEPYSIILGLALENDSHYIIVPRLA